MQAPIYGARPLTLKLQPGMLFHMRQAADKLGLTLIQFAQYSFALVPDGRGIPRLIVRAPDARNVAVTGTCGSIVGTLADIMSGNVAIDEPAEATPRRLAACRQPIIVGHADLERDADGKLTGRIDPARRQRRPGRNRKVQAERARDYLAQRPDLNA
jgi:hypothetical protein